MYILICFTLKIKCLPKLFKSQKKNLKTINMVSLLVDNNCILSSGPSSGGQTLTPSKVPLL